MDPGNWIVCIPLRNVQNWQLKEMSFFERRLTTFGVEIIIVAKKYRHFNCI